MTKKYGSSSMVVLVGGRGYGSRSYCSGQGEK